MKIFFAVIFFILLLINMSCLSSNGLNYSDERKKALYSENINRTVFLNAFNGKELFILQGNYSSSQLVEYNGNIYLITFDKAEENQIYMLAKNIKRNIPEPSMQDF